ncbi:MAG: hypothetical protein FJ314_10985 [SAR202 cluster bacterium]|nr:hypothetical protein [Alphaproteobacteria bacterium]MBM3960262.1 hypothetical protein [SAR202 cluster bacterium]
MMDSGRLSRRRFLHVCCGLIGFGSAGYAAPLAQDASSPGYTGPLLALKHLPPALVDDASSPSYTGPLLDSHSHVHGGRGPIGAIGEAELLQAMERAGIERVVAFTADPNKAKAFGGRVIPVAYSLSGPPPNLRAMLKDRLFRGQKTSARHFPFPMMPQGIQVLATDRHIREAAALAAETRTPLTIHCDGPQTDDLAALCREYREAPIIWAHAGGIPPHFGGGASSIQVKQMLDEHPNLFADFSARMGGQWGIAPLHFVEWQSVVLAHQTRFLFGIDVFMPMHLAAVPAAAIRWRRWLGQLPPAVAEQVAYKNAERLFLG